MSLVQWYSMGELRWLLKDREDDGGWGMMNVRPIED